MIDPRILEKVTKSGTIKFEIMYNPLRKEYALHVQNGVLNNFHFDRAIVYSTDYENTKESRTKYYIFDYENDNIGEAINKDLERLIEEYNNGVEKANS